MLIITISTFICITFGVMALYWVVFRPQSAITERLQELGQGRLHDASASAPNVPNGLAATFSERIATPLNRLVPPSATTAGKLQKKLMHAGYRAPNAPATFRAIQLLSLIGLPTLVVFVCIISGRPLNTAFGYIMFAVFAGFIVPRYTLDKLTRKRQLRLQWGLADALDLMVISIEAGLGLNAAMVRVSEELMDVHPDICKEFELTNLEIHVGREREEAFRNLAERTGVDDLRSLTAMLIQADRFGTSIAKAVRVYADSLRTKRRQRAEQAAQKAAVKLLFPLACFLFPTLFIVVLGPAALNLMDTFGRM